MVAYNTSKAAVVNFTRTLAGEWGKYNINVNALAPGMFPSKMTKGTIDRIGAESLAGHAPLLRIGDDDDLKGATLLFASQAGKHITGQVLPIDGGVSAIIAAVVRCAEVPRPHPLRRACSASSCCASSAARPRSPCSCARSSPTRGASRTAA